MEEVEGVEYLCSSLSVRHEHFVEMRMHVVRSSQCEDRLYFWWVQYLRDKNNSNKNLRA